MKTFYEWLELREAGFFGNLFGKKAQPAPAKPAPVSAPAPEKQGMDLDAFRRLMDGPNYDPARYATAQDQEEKQMAQPAPKPAPSQPRLSSSPQNPEEYLEEVVNKYWMNDEELQSKYSTYKKTNDPGALHLLYFTIAIGQSFSGKVVESVKNAMIEILEKKFGWRAFPETDTVELGPGSEQLDPDQAIFVDGRLNPSGTVRVLARGFMDRRFNPMVKAGVVRMR